MDERVKRYTSEQIDVTYHVDRCIHAAECVRGLPAVFDTAKRPWVQPGNAPADVVAEVVIRCPTGALHFERKDGGPAEPLPEDNVVVPTVDGPYHVRGQIRIVDPDGEVLFDDVRLALCRCGQSDRKPLCDGSHHRAGFADRGQVEAGDRRRGEEDGTLRVEPSANGPLLLRGDFEIRSADGSTVYRTTRAALCRCGGSANKPFCDGTHRRNGFVTDGA